MIRIREVGEGGCRPQLGDSDAARKGRALRRCGLAVVGAVAIGGSGLWFVPAGQAACTPISIVDQARSQLVQQGCRATFRVEWVGTEPVYFQWYRDGALLPDATNSTYTTAERVSAADDGSIYLVSMSNPCSDAGSEPVQLFVRPDAVPPALVRAHPGAAPDQIVLEFRTGCQGPGGGLEPASATRLLNYTLSDGLAVGNAQLACTGSNVILTTSPLAEGASYTVTVRDLQDLAGQLMVATQTTFRADALQRGMLRRDVFRGLAGGSLTELTNAAAFPYCPDQSGLVASFEAPSYFGERYGQRLSGLLIPPTTTNYVFHLSADDQGALFLSTDDTAANKRLIAAVSSATAPRAWGCAAAPACGNVSAALPLEAGRRYYVEALMKQEANGDHLAVAWQTAGGPAPRPGRDVLSGTYLATYAAAGAQVTITQQPLSTTAVAGCQASFSVAVAVQPAGTPLAYQWQRNSMDIPGATRSSYVTPSLSLADNLAVYRCFVRAGGVNRASANAFLTVTADVVPPGLAGAVSYSPGRVLVFFTKAIASPSAGYFHIDGIPISSAGFLDPDNRTVAELVLSGPLLVPWSRYTLTVERLEDDSGNRLVPDPSVAGFVAWEALPSAPVDVLRLLPAAGWVVLEWAGVVSLETGSTPAGPWQDLPEATSPWPLNGAVPSCGGPAPALRQFFRARLALP